MKIKYLIISVFILVLGACATAKKNTIVLDNEEPIPQKVVEFKDSQKLTENGDTADLSRTINTNDIVISLGIEEETGEPFLEFSSPDKDFTAKYDDGSEEAISGAKVLPLSYFITDYVSPKTQKEIAERAKTEKVPTPFAEYRRKWKVTEGSSEDNGFKIFSTGCCKSTFDTLDIGISIAKSECLKNMKTKVLSYIPRAVSNYLDKSTAVINWDEKLDSTLEKFALVSLSYAQQEDYYVDANDCLWVLMSVPTNIINDQVELAFKISNQAEKQNEISATKADILRKKALSYYSGYTIKEE